MIINKEHEGKIIYAIGTGNNSRRHNRDHIYEFEVLKVNRKYAVLDSHGCVDSYDREKGYTQSAANTGYALNAGYKFYESVEAIERDKELSLKTIKIADYFRLTSHNKLSEEQIDQIYDLIFKE